MEEFLREDFSFEDPGSFFPSFQALSRSNVVCGKGLVVLADRKQWHRRADYAQERLAEVLKSTAPVFHSVTQDNVTFRIYQTGRLEVRSTQEPGAPETVCAVFSSLLPPRVGKVGSTVASGSELIVTVTQYVQRARRSRAITGQREERSCCHFFVVLDGEAGRSVVTEMLPNHKASWVWGPEILEGRLHEAKVTRRTDCRSSGITFADAECIRAQVMRGTWASPCNSSKTYAEGIYSSVVSVN
mmetsp:Transcript_27646/g.64489  ORF Transcript_27646/g.64489 Transcript_27646/m.64489 type:complete len:243 (-) Transcript_27646:426-1154(-)